VRSGYDPTYGARPLKRAIQREVETPLAKQILGGTVRDGQTVWIDADTAGTGLRFETKATAPRRAKRQKCEEDLKNN
jgi:ATP-dependent Clp protease ATP-binding subunit ClpB